MDEKIKSVDNQAIGQRMRQERERLSLTREQLAEVVDLAPLYIGQLERGERQMSLDTLLKITNCLNITADYLLHGKTSDEEVEKDRIICLLNKCPHEELSLIENLILLILPHFKK